MAYTFVVTLLILYSMKMVVYLARRFLGRKKPKWWDAAGFDDKNPLKDGLELTELQTVRRKGTAAANPATTLTPSLPPPRHPSRDRRRQSSVARNSSRRASRGGMGSPRPPSEAGSRAADFSARGPTIPPMPTPSPLQVTASASSNTRTSSRGVGRPPVSW